MKIKTGLPYDFSLMSQIKEEGAIVDMSNLNYPSIEEKDTTRVSYIFLRNTEYDTNKSELDFSNCSYKFKESFLLFYLKGDIVYHFNELANTIIQTLGIYCGVDFNIKSILTTDETKTFIENNKDFINELLIAIHSLSMYPILRLDIEDESFKQSFNEIKHIDKFPFNSNFKNLIQTSMFSELYTFPPENIEPVIYNDYFTNDNNELFSLICKYTPFNALLYGMSVPDEWTMFVDDLEKQIKENVKNA